MAAVRQLGLQLVERGDQVRLARKAVHVGRNADADAGQLFDHCRRKRELARARQQVDRAYEAFQPPPAPHGPHDLRIHRRQAAAIVVQREVLEDHIGRAAKGRHVARLGRRNDGVGALRLGARMHPDRQAGPAQHFAVRPDTVHAEDFALAQRDGEADGVGIVALHGSAALAAADALLCDRLPHLAGPDDLPGETHAAEDARHGRAVAAGLQLEALQPRAFEDAVVESAGDGACRGRDGQRGQCADTAAGSGLDAGNGERGHAVAPWGVSGKRKAWAMRRDQKGASQLSTTARPQ